MVSSTLCRYLRFGQEHPVNLWSPVSGPRGSSCGISGLWSPVRPRGPGRTGDRRPEMVRSTLCRYLRFGQEHPVNLRSPVSGPLESLCSNSGLRSPVRPGRRGRTGDRICDTNTHVDGRPETGDSQDVPARTGDIDRECRGPSPVSGLRFVLDEPETGDWICYTNS